MTSLNGCHTLLGTTTGTGYNNHSAIVFALSLHWSSDSVGCSIWKQKSLPGFDDLDETRRIWPRPASFFRFLGGQRMFNRFPSQTPHLLLFFLLVRAACMASETVRCFGDGNYPRDLTNFFGHSFLAFANGIGSESGLELEKEMGWMIFNPRWAFFSGVLLLVYVPDFLPLLDLSSIYTMIFLHLHLSVKIKISTFIPQAYEKKDGTAG
jgi:hypothetical protein